MIKAIALAATLALAGTSPLLAATPHAFTAHYEVLKDGSPVGEAVMRLRANGSNWLYTTKLHGKGGLAGLLGLSIDESSNFRMRDGHPEMLAYDYRLDAGIKKRKRSMQTDWTQNKVTVADDGHDYRYAAAPALVERHLLPLALGYALTPGQHDLALQVAVKDRVETQRFRTLGKESIAVPAGRIDAQKVQRSDAGKNFTAWYAPKKYATPVKLVHGKYTLLLESYVSGSQAASD